MPAPLTFAFNRVQSVPLVSICIPVHNGGNYLREALDSVLAQDYPRLEIVVSDNASDDDTGEIVRRYADADSRVRYIRNAANVGAAANFQLAIDAATGEYCTWLAHDDLFTTSEYVSATVGYMERHRDVVLCACDLAILDHEQTGAFTEARFPEIYPDRDWKEARKEFFHWPQRAVHYTIYGMYRRPDLLTLPAGMRTYRGRPIVTDMEFPALTSLALRGRIVALPTHLRASRCHMSSAFHREQKTLTGLDKVVLGANTRLGVLRRVLGASLPAGEKADLVGVALANFAHGNVERPTDYTSITRMVDREARMLRRTAAERAHLVARLKRDVSLLRRQAGLPVPSALEAVAESGGAGDPADTPSRARELMEVLRAIFRAPSDRQVEALQTLYAECARLRPICDESLRTIERLHHEAAHLLGMTAVRSGVSEPLAIEVDEPRQVS